MSNVHYWPEEYKLEVAHENLFGDAKNWYLANRTDLNIWKKFEDLLKESFMSQVSLAER